MLVVAGQTSKPDNKTKEIKHFEAALLAPTVSSFFNTLYRVHIYNIK